MRPAWSLILFTTLSGAGFGLLAILALGFGPVSGLAELCAFALAVLLCGAGLLSAAAHLGRPDRAMLALREWRSSWLSREAWLAAAALGTGAAHAASALLGAAIWPIGALAAALSAATVGATAMIYASLRTVPRWHHWSVPLLFWGYAATGGALLSGQGRAAIALLPVLWVGQLAAWVAADRRRGASDTGRATGLGHLGHVRAFEPPHTGPSYLTREMLFQVGRRHAVRLRWIAVILGGVVPLGLLTLPHGIWVAAPVHLAGVAVARWLFFAEAEHMMGHYYGARDR